MLYNDARYRAAKDPFLPSVEGESRPGSRRIQAGELVGREDELREIWASLSIRKGAVRGALIRGEIGIGKSRFAEELCSKAEREGTAVVRVFCYPNLSTMALVPFISSMGGWRPLGFAQPSDAASRQTLNPPIPGQMTRELQAAITGLFASRPGVLLVEDIHWADASSLLLLNDILDHGPPGLMVVATQRTGEAQSRMATSLLLRVQEKSHIVNLLGLGVSDSAELVRAQSGGGNLSDEEVRWLHDVSGGNPLLLIETLAQLDSSGAMDRRRVAHAIELLSPKDRLAAVIDHKLERLPKRAARILAACSAIGFEFRKDLGIAASKVDDASFEDAVRLAIELDLLLPEDTLASNSYRFHHPIVAIELYRRLTSNRRRRLHARIAEACGRQVPPPPAAVLAYHFANAGSLIDRKTALVACRQAAEDAERVFSFDDAVYYWELAVRLAASDQEARGDLLNRCARAARASGNWARAAEAWRQAAELYRAGGQIRNLGQTALALGDLLRWMQHRDAREWLELARSLLPEESLESATALALLGSVDCLESATDDGLTRLREAEEIAGKAGGSSYISYWVSYGFLTAGVDDRSYEHARLGYKDAGRSGDTVSAALLARSLFTHEISRLRPERARAYAHVVDSSLDETDPRTVIRSFVCRTTMGAYAGQWPEVATLCDEWLRRLRLIGPYQIATAKLVLGIALSNSGERDAGIAEMRSALPHLAEMRPIAALHLARAYFDEGNLGAMERLVAEHAQEVLAGRRHRAARVVLAELAGRADGVIRNDRACLEALGEESRQMVTVYIPLSVDRVRGRLQGGLGLWSDAVANLEQAILALKRGGAGWELALAYQDLAQVRRLRGRKGDAAKADVLEAKHFEILDRLGLSYAGKLHPPDAKRRFDSSLGLTKREVEVLNLVASGLRNQEIAEQLFVSPRTVKRHLENVFSKLNVVSRTEAVMAAIRAGLVGPLGLEDDRSAPHPSPISGEVLKAAEKQAG